MKTNVWCCDDIFRYAKVSAIVELCLSGIMNIVLLLGLIIATNSGTEILQLGEPVSKTEATNNDNHQRDVVVCSEKRQRRKTKAPQSRSSAIS